MIEWIKKNYKYILLGIPVLLGVIWKLIETIRDSNTREVLDAVNVAKGQDIELERQVNEVSNRAQEEREKADAVEKEMVKRSIDKDWYKNFIVLLVAGTFLWSDYARAQCQWSLGIKETEQGFLYTEECHKEVGRLVTQEPMFKEEITHLKEAYSLQEQATKLENERATLWRDQAFKLEDRLKTNESLQKYNDWFYFAAGMLATGLSVWLAGQVYSK